MSRSNKRWVRDANTPEVVSSNRNGFVVEVANFRGDAIRFNMDYYSFRRLTFFAQQAGEKEAKILEAAAASIRREIGLPERKFVEGGVS